MDVSALRARYLQQPFEVSLETLALCNARCTFCPYPTMKRIGAELSLPTIVDLLTQMTIWEEPFYISPFKVNEPLLDSRLRKICGLIVTMLPRAKIRLFTNGSPLVNSQLDWIQALPVPRLQHLWVSLNSTDPDEYTALMGIKYETTAKRLDTLHVRVAQGAFNHPVVLSRVLQSSRRDFALSFDDGAASDRRFFEDAAERWPLFSLHPIKRDGWLGYVEPTEDQVPSSGCGRWFELNIMATGVASLCCMDGEGEYSIGDVKQSRLLQLYNQPHLLARREFALNRKGINPCERCTY